VFCISLIKFIRIFQTLIFLFKPEVMKNLFLLIPAMFIAITASSQSCLPDGITFSNQDQIDSFHDNYPGCTEIEGMVTITGSVSNLNGLNMLTSIGGDLEVTGAGALTNFGGLSSLNHLGGGLRISNNDELTSLSGLEGLTYIFDVSISDNISLISLNGLNNVTSVSPNGYLWITGNNSLTNLTGLENLAHIWGDLVLRNNNSLTSLSGLNNVKTIRGDLELYENNALTSLSGLAALTTIEGSIRILNNGSLVDLNDLNNLTIVERDIYILYNPALISLSGLDNINAETIEDLIIRNNIALSTCNVQSICEFITGSFGYSDIYDNASGCNSLTEVQSKCRVRIAEATDQLSILNFYPTPTSGIAYFTFHNSQYQWVSLKIFDMQGYLVETLIAESLTAGTHYFTWNTSKFPPGIYFFHLSETGNQISEIGKIVVMK
jgi:hypothetical protein